MLGFRIVLLLINLFTKLKLFFKPCNAGKCSEQREELLPPRRTQNCDDDKKPLFKDDSVEWCIFHGWDNIHGIHWKVASYGFVETEKGWSDIKSGCPGGIGAYWSYYNHSHWAS